MDLNMHWRGTELRYTVRKSTPAYLRVLLLLLLVRLVLLDGLLLVLLIERLQLLLVLELLLHLVLFEVVPPLAVQLLQVLGRLRRSRRT